jgi:hypothetical protein
MYLARYYIDEGLTRQGVPLEIRSNHPPYKRISSIEHIQVVFAISPQHILWIIGLEATGLLEWVWLPASGLHFFWKTCRGGFVLRFTDVLSRQTYDNQSTRESSLTAARTLCNTRQRMEMYAVHPYQWRQICTIIPRPCQQIRNHRRFRNKDGSVEE